ncbi:terminase large subunit domain-containing protein [Brevibacillus sp. HB2.2]|uniref:terminase large subunit domain-containing protein n=1 Tax=Brevibacillus sp. HB2.2 TaxID=2738846 RepID=UPI00156A90FB|nr:terminase family protein [Brevibacillus sp. HB2.2]NRS51791.1 terminase [Brevibacillus sp. HB2.2]
MTNLELDLDPFADWAPHPKQIEVMECDARNVVMNCGRRGGKTNVGARKFFDNILADIEGEKGLPYKPPLNLKKVKKPKPRLEYWCVAPDYNMSEIQQEELSQVIPEDMIDTWNASGNFVWLTGYILIRFKSAENPKKLVGRGLDGVWLDEASKMKPETWSGYLAYALADKGGWSIWTTTPEGINWFAEEIVLRGQFIDAGLEDDRYQDDPDWRNFYWTSKDNPIPELQKNIQRMIETYPERYVKREIYAKFNVFHGQVYEEFDRSVHCVDIRPVDLARRLFIVTYPNGEEREVMFKRYIGGMDHGWNDPAVLLVFGCTDEEYYLIEESYRQQTNVLVVDDQGKLEDCLVKNYLELQEKYPMDVIWADPSEPEDISTYRRYKLPVKPAENAIGPGIRRVSSLYKVKESSGRPNLYIARTSIETIKETGNYKYKEQNGIMLEEPVDKDNHTQDSKRYAMYNDWLMLLLAQKREDRKRNGKGGWI